jgi:predicted porin
MKKTLVALAALAAASAFAQSTVGIKGTFDVSLANQNTTYGGGATRSSTGLLNSQTSTSNITFFGTEDLGGGLKANFLLEQDFNATSKTDAANLGAASNTTIGNKAVLGGEAYVGVAGSFGEIKLGAPNTPSLDVTGRTPFGTKVGSGFSDGTSGGLGIQGLGHVRESNSIVVTAPTFNGLTVKAGFAAATVVFAEANRNDAAVSQANAKRDIGFTYVNGPLKAVVASYEQKTKYKQTHGYVAYTVGGLTATYGFSAEERLAATGTVGTLGGTASTATGQIPLGAGKLASSNVALAYKVGATSYLANVGKLDDKSATNYDGKISAVGVKYELSPRTSLNARLVKLTVDNTNSQAIQAKEQKTTLFGLVHSF